MLPKSYVDHQKYQDKSRRNHYQETPFPFTGCLPNHTSLDNKSCVVYGLSPLFRTVYPKELSNNK